MKIMYRAVYSSDEILPYEVERDTGKTVFYIHKGTVRRESKVNNYTEWHDTFEDAKNSMIKRATNEIEAIKYRLSLVTEKKTVFENLQDETLSDRHD